jgi:hypothetical protein
MRLVGVGFEFKNNKSSIVLQIYSKYKQAVILNKQRYFDHVFCQVKFSSNKQILLLGI